MIKAELEGYRNKDGRRFMNLASNIKLLFPEKFPEINLGQSDWVNMMTLFGEDKLHDQWSLVLQEAIRLKILVAKKAEITGNGIIITPSSKSGLAQPIPAIPEARKF